MGVFIKFTVQTLNAQLSEKFNRSPESMSMAEYGRIKGLARHLDPRDLSEYSDASQSPQVMHETSHNWFVCKCPVIDLFYHRKMEITTG